MPRDNESHKLFITTVIHWWISPVSWYKCSATGKRAFRFWDRQNVAAPLCRGAPYECTETERR